MIKKIACFIITVITGVYANAQTWSSVANGISGSSSVLAWSLCSYDSVLYAGGWFDTAGVTPVSDMAQWNGSNWSAPGVGTSGYISAMTVYNGNLYVGGQFDSIGGIAANSIAMWNGSAWITVGKGFQSAQWGVYALAVYNGELYAGGAFDSADGKSIYGISKWNGTTWSAVGSGIYAADEEDGVFSLAVYNGELYVGGGFDSAGGVPVKEIAKWNGTNWSDVGHSMNDGGAVSTLAVYNGNLYAGGMFDTAGGVPVNRIAMWNGTVWSPLDSGITGEATWAVVNSLISYNNELYVGGYFDTVNGKPINSIAKWNGTTWSKVGGSIGVSNGGSIDAMTIYNNSLYVGGGFDSVGGVYAKNIAMWTAPNSINEINKGTALAVYPDPVLTNVYVKINGITGEKMYYRIYDQLGQEVKSGDFTHGVNTIDVSDFSTGIYLVSVSANDKLFSTKFIKQ